MTIMLRHPVKSSALESVGYDPLTKTLEIEFKEGGAVWQYLKVPATLYKKFIEAESLGNFFVTCIKGKYREERITYLKG